MKKIIFLLSLLLVVWISLSSFWFVCRTRCDCRNSPYPAAVAGLMNAPARALEAAAAEAGKLVTEAGTQKIYFGTACGSADMSTLTAEYTDRLKLFLDNTPGARVMVTGHADSQGPDDYNMMLSTLRARYVKNWLVISADIDPAQITAEGKGLTAPAADNSTEDGRKMNRRTELYILTQ